MNPRKTIAPRFALFGSLLVAATLLFAAVAPSAFGAPVWRLSSVTDTTAPAGGQIDYHLQLANVSGDNVGCESANPARLCTLTIDLPAGLTTSVAPTAKFSIPCTGLGPGPTRITCTPNAFAGAFALPASSEVSVSVAVSPSASGTLTTKFALYGGSSGSGQPATRADGSPCASAPPGVPCAATVDPTLISPELPPFGVDAFEVAAYGEGLDPSLSTQAGGHPYAQTTSIDFNTRPSSHPLVKDLEPTEPTRDVFVDLPPGFIGTPTPAAECSASALAAMHSQTETKSLCPVPSQLGVASLRYYGGGGDVEVGPYPLFRMVAPPGVPARFGFNAFGTLVALDASLRSGGDYGLTVSSRAISQGLILAGTSVTFWGDPTDPSHDSERACPGGTILSAPHGFAPVATDPACKAGYNRPEPFAFFRNPTSCTGPIATGLHIDSWFNPGAQDADRRPDLSDPAWRSATSTSHQAPGYPYAPSEWGAAEGMSGCEDVPFEPTITAKATSNQADSPTGLDFDLFMPQQALTDPDAIAQSDLRTARTILPAGMTVNPGAADGLVGCSQAEVGLDNTQDAKCPEASAIGTVEIDSPQLDDLLVGQIYQAKQFDNPNGSLLGFYTVAKGSGVIVKLFAHVELNKDTGQLETVFDTNPQLPFNHYRLHFKDGPRATLINPPSCGTATTNAIFTPFARPGEEVHRQSSYEITTGPNGQPCPNGGFDPKLSAGTRDPIGGAFSPFNLRLTREDGTRVLTGVSATLPEGLLGKLAGIPYCSDAALGSLAKDPSGEPLPGSGAAQIASPSCPAASLIGHVTVGSGAGASPFFLDTGRVYLAGPYRGAPLSFAIVTPAVAGPLDLGNVLVRTALRVDPTTTRITADSDPLPVFVHGIPLDLRDVRVAIDRPNFTLNPTSCDPMSIDAQISGAGGASAARSNGFQVAECDRLAFKPKLALRLKGDTERGGHPALRATLTMPAGGANIDRAAVAFPHSEFLAQSHIRTICTRVQFAADICPKGSVYGHARAFSPLLAEPVEGPVYLRSSSNPLPDLVAALRGQIDVDLVGRIDSKNGGIRNTFDFVPDAPVTKFVITMQGGKKGLLENSRNICRHVNRVTALFDGQNGKAGDSRPALKADCGKKGKGKGQR